MIEIEKMSVAIVDDAENMCKLMRSMLKSLHIGGTFYTGYNGMEALEIVREHPVDLLIMDWNMPVMDGLETLEHIRADESLQDLAVMMVTGESEREKVAAAAESDIDAYILKPLNKNSLGKKIKAAVDRANNPPPIIAHLKAARALKKAGNFEGAKREFQNAARADPMSSKPLRELGILFFERGDSALAEKILCKASVMNRYDVFAHHYLGEIYLKRNDIDRAVRCFEQAMQVSPRNISRGVNFGKALVKKRAFEKASAVFEKAFALSGDNVTLMEEIADYCIENNALSFAARLYQSMLSSIVDRPDIMMKLGIVLERTGAHLEAARCFSDVEKKDPRNLEAKFHLVENYLVINQTLRADQVIRNILKIDPENDRALEILKRIT